MKLQEKGITLVALIITVVLLLIIAGVTINEIVGEGIIGKANEAKDNYESAQEGGKGIVEEFQRIMEVLFGRKHSENDSSEGNNQDNKEESEDINPGEDISQDGTTAQGVWVQNGLILTKTNAYGQTIKLKVGDYVNYNEGVYTHTPKTSNGIGTEAEANGIKNKVELSTNNLTTENLNWRVLGVNGKGELELISDNPTTQEICIANDTGYKNLDDNLKNFCNDLYGKGTYAVGARSLNAEDINKLSKYDKTTYADYGQKWIYRLSQSTNYMQYSKNDGNSWYNITNSNYQTFRVPDDAEAISANNIGSKEVENTYYEYEIQKQLNTITEYTSDEIEIITDMITKDANNEDTRYLLSSKTAKCLTHGAHFYISHVSSGDIKQGIIFYSFEQFANIKSRVRPVVSLNSNITLEGNGNNIGDKTNMWNIVQK